MNWRRGFFRLWVTASCLWVCAVAALPYRAGVLNWLWLPPLPPGWTQANVLENIRYVVIIALGPPLGVGVAFWLVNWVIAGFR